MDVDIALAYYTPEVVSHFPFITPVRLLNKMTLSHHQPVGVVFWNDLSIKDRPYAATSRDA